MPSGAAQDRGGGRGAALGRLYRLLSPRRRAQLFLTLGVMMVGAVAELLTIGAALTFLILLADTGPSQLPSRFSAWLDTTGASSVLAASLLLVTVAVLAALVRLTLAWLSQRFVAAAGCDMATRIYSRTLRQPYAAFVRQNSGDVLAGLAKVQLLVTNLLQPAMQGVIGLVLALCITALLFVIDPLIAGAVAATVGTAYAILSLASRRRLQRNSLILSEAANARTKIVQEGIGGIRDIILDQSQPVFETQFERIEASFRRAQAVNSLISIAPRFIIEAAGIVAIALTALLMSRDEGGIVRALPVLGALALGAQRLLPLMQQAYVGLAQTLGNLQLLNDVVGLMEQPVAPVAPRERIAPGEGFRESIDFASVSFGFEGSGFALRDISLTIPHGSRVGIAGKTGCGKSTLLDLLMGLLEPTAGEIRIDGAALDDSNRARWQAQIAHVPQAIYLSDDSIAANIAFGVPPGRIDLARVKAAAVDAHLADFVDGLPESYATRVGERGIRLSGGQRQRIGIARALYKGATVLILDEATSALDDETEAAVIASLMAMSGDITLIMVAHRKSTLARCDRIFRLDGGRLA